MILEEERYDPSGEILLALEELRAAIERIQINDLPAPIVLVEPPDLRELQAELVNTVNALKPGIDSEDVAEALARKWAPPDASINQEPLAEAIRKLEKTLDHRMRGMGTQAYGGGSVSLQANQTVGITDRPVNTAKATYTTSGNHTLITPASGESLIVGWLYAQAKAALNTDVVTVTFTLGTKSYEVELTGSQPFAHTAIWQGAADQSLIVNTSSTAAVLVNADYR